MLCSDGDDCKVRDKKVEQRMVQTDVHSHAAYPLERSPFVVPLVAHTDTENRRYRACSHSCSFDEWKYAEISQYVPKRALIMQHA